jgi:HEAT repeat protein
MTRPGERTTHRELRDEVVRLYGSGLGVAFIAAELSITPNRAQKLLSEGLLRVPEQSDAEILAGAEMRLDHAAAVAKALTEDPDKNVRLRAATALSQIEATRTRLTGTWRKPLPEEVA